MANRPAPTPSLGRWSPWVTGDRAAHTPEREELGEVLGTQPQAWNLLRTESQTQLYINNQEKTTKTVKDTG